MSAGVLLAIKVGVVGLLLTAPPEAPAGDAAVVAQHVVTLAGGDHHWVAAALPIAAEPAAVTVDDPTMLAVVSGGVVLADLDGAPQYALDAGEAGVLLPGTGFTQRSSAADVPGELLQVVLAAGPAAGTADEVGGAFPLAAGDYDLELVRDVLGPNQVLTLPAAAAPTLLRTDGEALVTDAATALATELVAGSTVALGGALTVVNTGDQSVTVLAARVTAIGATVAAAGSSEPEPVESNEPTTSVGSSGSATSVVPTTASAPTSVAPSSAAPGAASTTAPPGPADTLDPGAINTNPSSFRDSDSDGLTDAEEAAFGSDPNNFDTDGDALIDYDEQAAGTNPRNSDSDGDGFEDGFEHLYGNNPASAGDYPGQGQTDTDGDRYSDIIETNLGYDPNDPGSHP